MFWRIQGEGEFLGGDVAQAKNDPCVLDRGGLGFGCWRAGFTQRRRRGNGSGLKTFSGGGGEMLLGGEPLVDFCIAGDTSTEDLAFQPGQFELLIADRVAGTHGCRGERAPPDCQERSRRVSRPLEANWSSDQSPFPLS